MQHEEMHRLLKEQLKKRKMNNQLLLPILDYMQKENKARYNEFAKLLNEVSRDLAVIALEERQLTLPI